MNLWIDVDCLMFFHAFQFPFGGAASFFFMGLWVDNSYYVAAVTFSLGVYGREKTNDFMDLNGGYKFSKPTHITGL